MKLLIIRWLGLKITVTSNDLYEAMKRRGATSEEANALMNLAEQIVLAIEARKAGK